MTTYWLPLRSHYQLSLVGLEHIQLRFNTFRIGSMNISKMIIIREGN